MRLSLKLQKISQKTFKKLVFFRKADGFLWKSAWKLSKLTKLTEFIYIASQMRLLLKKTQNFQNLGF